MSDDREKQIREMLWLERNYWLEAPWVEDKAEWDKATIIASGAIANVLAAIMMGQTLEEFRNDISRRGKNIPSINT